MFACFSKAAGELLTVVLKRLQQFFFLMSPGQCTQITRRLWQRHFRSYTGTALEQLMDTTRSMEIYENLKHFARCGIKLVNLAKY